MNTEHYAVGDWIDWDEDIFSIIRPAGAARIEGIVPLTEQDPVYRLHFPRPTSTQMGPWRHSHSWLLEHNVRRLDPDAVRELETRLLVDAL